MNEVTVAIASQLTSDQIKQKAKELGFHKVGIAAVDQVDDTYSSRLQAWLKLGYQADMAWMANPKRQDIRLVMPEVKTLICVALNYYTPHQRPQGQEYAKISRYGWGRDYHKVLHKKLKAFATWLQTQGEGIQAKYYADTGPIPDKFWAQQAGIGWIAKNGNVITREYGSWVFLGEVLTNLDLNPDTPHTQHCGTCSRCLQACPTGAITEPFVVDANRCIAYHTIENRDAQLPEAVKPHLQGWVAGCDICQDVCPWNQRFATPTDVPDFQPYPDNVAPTLLELAEISDLEWDKKFTASALRRIKPEMLRRNACANLEVLPGSSEVNAKGMTLKVIIFDFDGTIADSLDVIVKITNNLAREFGYKQITPDELGILRNLSYRQIIRQSRVSILKLPFLVNKVKTELKYKIPDLSPIPGIPEALINLKNQGHILGIITSNSKENVTEFLEINNLFYLFNFIYSETKLFGKARTISKCLAKHHFHPDNVIYVGDETRDIEAAKKAKIKMVAVTWGFNSPEILAAHHPDFLIEQPSELLTATEKN